MTAGRKSDLIHAVLRPQRSKLENEYTDQYKYLCERYQYPNQNFQGRKNE